LTGKVSEGTTLSNGPCLDVWCDPPEHKLQVLLDRSNITDKRQWMVRKTDDTWMVEWICVSESVLVIQKANPLTMETDESITACFNQVFNCITEVSIKLTIDANHSSFSIHDLNDSMMLLLYKCSNTIWKNGPFKTRKLRFFFCRDGSSLKRRTSWSTLRIPTFLVPWESYVS
jgi:hypothetical protein